MTEEAGVDSRKAASREGAPRSSGGRVAAPVWCGCSGAPDWLDGPTGRSGAGRDQLSEQLLDAGVDVVADAPHHLDGLAGRVLEFPVFIALAGVDRAGVPAAHGDDHISGAKPGSPQGTLVNWNSHVSRPGDMTSGPLDNLYSVTGIGSELRYARS
jgi:hypothetical protein